MKRILIVLLLSVLTLYAQDVSENVRNYKAIVKQWNKIAAAKERGASQIDIGAKFPYRHSAGKFFNVTSSPEWRYVKVTGFGKEAGSKTGSALINNQPVLITNCLLHADVIIDYFRPVGLKGSIQIYDYGTPYDPQAKAN